jgi:hypothetical protein
MSALNMLRFHDRGKNVRKTPPSKDFEIVLTCGFIVLNRVKSNAQRRKEAKEKGESVQLKRLPVGPRGSRTIEFTEVESLAPQAYDTHI